MRVLIIHGILQRSNENAPAVNHASTPISSSGPQRKLWNGKMIAMAAYSLIAIKVNGLNPRIRGTLLAVIGNAHQMGSKEFLCVLEDGWERDELISEIVGRQLARKTYNPETGLTVAVIDTETIDVLVTIAADDERTHREKNTVRIPAGTFPVLNEEIGQA